MKSGTKKIIWGILIALILIVSIMALGRNFNLFSIAGGSSTLSLTQANLQSSNQYLNGKVWLLTFTRGSLAQSYYGTFTPSDVDLKTSDKTTTTKSFTLAVNYDPTTCNYGISNTNFGVPIYTDLHKITWTYIPFINPCDIPEAKSRGLPNVLWVGKPSLSLTCWAVGYGTQAPVGTIQEPSVNSKFTVNLNVQGGDTASATFDTLSGSTQGSIGNFAYAVWNGNLVSGASCDSATGFTKSAYRTAYVNGNWRVVKADSYNNYQSAVNQQLFLFSSDTDVNNWVSNANYWVAQALSSQSIGGTISNAGSLSNAQISITTQSPIEFPLSTLYIKADEIGIFTPVPDIRIESSTSSCFRTGSGDGLIAVTLKNYGTDAGGANLYATCANPFVASQNIQVNLQVGQSQTYNIPISATATQKTNGQCTIYVQSTGKNYQASTNVCVDPQITCTTPYPQTFCSIDVGSDVVKQCSQDGGTSSITERCTASQYCSAGKCINKLLPPIGGCSAGQTLCSDNVCRTSCTVVPPVPVTECKWYESTIPQNEKVYAWYDVLHLGTPTLISTGQNDCVFSTPIIVVVLVVIVLLFILAMVLLLRKKRARRRR